MPNSYNKIWLHVVFSTKYRANLINLKIEKQIHIHMREQLIAHGCPVAMINGMPDHVHLLFLQNPKIAVADIIKQVKGNTSFWINEQKLIGEKFGWQNGYGAFSVSESQLPNVVNYIRNQKMHHSKITFDREFEDFIELHRLTNEG